MVMGWQNHRGETVSTFPPDFVARFFLDTGNPLTAPCAPASSIWFFNSLIQSLQAKSTQLLKSLYPFLVFWLFTLVEMMRILSKLGREIGECISAMLYLVVSQHAQIAFILVQPAYAELAI
jgi:hypothetical protein